MRKKREFHIKQVLDILWSYLMLTIIILVLFGVGLGIGYGIIRKNAEENVEARLSQLSDDIYDRVICYTKICDVLAANESVISFFDIQPQQTPEYQTAVAYLRRELNDVREVTNVPISDMALFYPGSKIVVSLDSDAAGMKQAREEFDSLFAGVITPKILREIPEDNYWTIFYGEKKGWIIRQVSHKSGKKAYVILEYQLEELVPISPEEGIVLLGDDTTVTYSSNGEMTSDSYQKIRNALLDNHKLRYDKKTYIASRSVFSLMRKDIMIVLSVSYFLSQMEALQWLLMALGSACLVCLAGIYYMVYKRIILPYRYFAETMGEDTSRANFHEVLANASANLLSIQGQQKAAEKERAYLIRLGVGELLNMLFRTPDDYAERIATRCLSLAGVCPGQSYFMFAVFHMEDEKFVFENMRKGSRKITPIFVLENLTRDLLFDKRVGIIATVNQCYYVLSTCVEGDTEQTLSSIINRLGQFYRENYAVTIATTDPLIGSEPKELQSIVHKTMNDAAYLRFWHKNKLSETEGEETESLTSYFKAMRNLINRLDAQDYAGAQLMFQQILERNLPRGIQELQITKYRIYSLIETLVAAISGQFDLGEDAIRKLDYEERLYKIDNIRDFRLESEKIFLEIMEIRQQCDGERDGAKRMERARAYIDQHFADNDLTVSSLAEHLEMSISYLSREFKRIVGCTVLDYIQKLRIDESKKLLTDNSVKDAGVKAGFGDTQGFIRVFKKYEGITPGEYKKSIQGL